MDTTDGVHPNPTGQTVIAQRYAATLHDLGVLPHTPSLVRSYLAWIPDARASVTMVDRRVRRFSWSFYQHRLTKTGATIRIDGSRLRRPLILRGRPGTDSITYPLERVRYTARLSPLRKSMEGSYGPAVAFTVP